MLDADRPAAEPRVPRRGLPHAPAGVRRAAAVPAAARCKPFTLKNGIKVYLVEQHALPIVSMDLNFDGGSITDPKGKDGLASVCTSMLTEGTEKLDKIAYSEALADIASSINAYAADDSQGVALSSLTKHLDATFALFADTILHARPARAGLRSHGQAPHREREAGAREPDVDPGPRDRARSCTARRIRSAASSPSSRSARSRSTTARSSSRRG